MPRLVAGPPSEPAPSSYKLAPSEAFIPESVTATFDGSGAGGTFLPTLSIYSQDGKLIARSPATPVAAGSSAEVTFAPLLRAAQVAAAGGGGYPFALSGINGFYSVASGVNTQFGIDSGDVWGSGVDSGIFTADAHATPGVYGLGIHATGTYALFWSVEYDDVFGFRVANPENFVAEAADGSGSRFVMLPAIGSNYGRGFADLSGNGVWVVSWISVFAIHGNTAAGDPVIIDGNQSTGQTLRAYTQLMAFQLSTDTFGF